MDWPTTYTISADGYEVVPDDGSTLLRSESGKARIQRFYGDTQYNIRFSIVALAIADIAAVRAFYETNKSENIVFTDPYTGVVYDTLFVQPPQMTRVYGRLADMEVMLTGQVAP